jgi:arylsulfatase A-like enzyme
VLIATFAATAYWSIAYRADFTHLLSVAPPLLILCVAILHRLLSGSRLGIGCSLLAAGAWLVAGLLATLCVFAAWDTPVDTPRGRLVVTEREARSATQLLRYLDAQPRGERILIAPMDPLYYFLSDRLIPSRFDLLFPAYFRPGDDERLARSLSDVDQVVYNPTVIPTVPSPLTAFAPNTAAELVNRFRIVELLDPKAYVMRPREGTRADEIVADIWRDFAPIPSRRGEEEDRRTSWMMYRVITTTVAPEEPSACFRVAHEAEPGQSISVLPMLHPAAWKPPWPNAFASGAHFEIRVSGPSPAPRVVFSEEREAEPPSEVLIALAPFAGRRIEIEFCASRTDRQSGWPFRVRAGWGEPRIVRRAGMEDTEDVARLPLSDAPPPAAVDVEGETRRAVSLASPYRGKICFPADPRGASRTLELGARTAGSGVRARLAVPEGDATEIPLGEDWSDLRAQLPSGSGCSELVLMGAASEVAVSTPFLLRSEARRPWVILYVVDTFRFDDSPYGGGAEHAAPAFAELAHAGIVYRRALGVTSWTRPAVASLLTGLGPSFHGVSDRQDRLPSSIASLPTLLADAGWFTIALSTNPNILPVWGFLPGFDRFVDVGSADWVQERGFAALRRRMLAVVKGRSDQPLFLYVHDNEPHVPYRPLPEYRELFSAPPEGSAAEIPASADDAKGLGEARLLYRAAIRATSDRFGTLLDALREAGRYEDALIVLVGDHGEEFGDHGRILHGQTLYQEQLHVPLVIKPPSGAAPVGAVAAAVSLEDVAPTVLALLGLPAPSSMAGRRLPFPGEKLSDRGTLVSELDFDGHRAESAIRWPWKYLRMQGESERLFDLAADPEEREDRAASRADVVAQLRTALERRRAMARSGLWLSCLAGEQPAVVRGEIRTASDQQPRVEAIGLEVADRVTARAGSIAVDFQLRPAESHPTLARLDPEIAARTQPDRDRVRIAELTGNAVEIRLMALPGGQPVRLEGPDGSLLPGSGEAIPLAQIAATVPPQEPLASDQARCQLYRVEPRTSAVPEESIDPSLRARLRALGYLD